MSSYGRVLARPSHCLHCSTFALFEASVRAFATAEQVSMPQYSGQCRSSLTSRDINAVHPRAPRTTESTQSSDRNPMTAKTTLRWRLAEAYHGPIVQDRASGNSSPRDRTIERAWGRDDVAWNREKSDKLGEDSENSGLLDRVPRGQQARLFACHLVGIELPA